MRVVVHDEPVAVGLRQPPRHGHRFGRSSGLVEQRGIGEIEAGELGHHRLEVEQRLEPALADLGLVRRVRGVPRRVLEHVANDHRGSDGAVVAHPDQAGSRLVERRKRAQLVEHRLGRAGCASARLPVMRIDGGTVWANNDSTESSPITESMCWRSSGVGDVCLRVNSPASTSSSRCARIGCSWG